MNKTLSNIFFLFIFLTTMQNKMCFAEGVEGEKALAERREKAAAAAEARITAAREKEERAEKALAERREKAAAAAEARITAAEEAAAEEAAAEEVADGVEGEKKGAEALKDEQKVAKGVEGKKKDADIEDDWEVVNDFKLNIVPSTDTGPLVQGQTSISPRFANIKEDLGKLIQFSYLLGKGAVKYEGIANISGWAPIGKKFSARRGFYAPDENFGYLAYNEDKDILVVVLRGSQNSADWVTNFASRASDASIHAGFEHKLASGWPAMSKAIVAFYNSLSPEKKGKLKIICMGHSQGGGLAQIAGLWLGELFRNNGLNNLSANQIWVYAVSSPRAFQENALQKFNAIVGKDNAIRHNVKHDIAGNVGPGDFVGSKIDKVVSPDLTERFLHFQDVGHLAMQGSIETAITGVAKTLKEIFREDNKGGIDWKNLLKAPVAYMHMGETGNLGKESDAVFDPDMLKTDFGKMLSEGKAHMDAKIA